MTVQYVHIVRRIERSKGERMPVQVIGFFGKNKEGIYKYRINATQKEEIYQIIDEAKSLGFKFWQTPNIEKVPGRTWSVLLELYFPKDMGYPEESK